MPAAPAPLADLFASADLLAGLEVSFAAIHLVSPVHGPSGKVVDSLWLPPRPAIA
ncbi:hypothetical protein [Hymenobacter sp. PAMC 26628]|uniref:hypothetical protein n=1 Tax=Hymenobacter sp. PAMC 26628 TaxID=1484118 RepID=UPI000B0477A5|nr:hypothetical protein [Hymenobacter sp. PAMC 26628]